MQISFPKKLTVAELENFNKRLVRQAGSSDKCWFEEHVEQDKKLVMDEIDSTSLLPKVLSRSIADYATPYSNTYRRVRAYAYHGLSQLRAFDVEVPLRVAGSSPREIRWSLWHEDVYRVWVQAILNINNFQEWSSLMMRAEGAEPGESLLSKIQEVGVEDGVANRVRYSGSLQFNYSSKELASFPLAVYWQNEKEVRLATKSTPILSVTHETFDTTIRDGCYDILKEHNVLEKGMRAKDLVIFCTSCNGQIADPAKGVEYLIWPNSDNTQDESPVCARKDVPCMTFRALRAFPRSKQKSQCGDNCIVS